MSRKALMNSDFPHSQTETSVSGWTWNGLLAGVGGATSPGLLAFGSVPAAQAEDCSKVSHQFHTFGQQASSSWASSQLDEMIPTEGESPCSSEDVQSPLQRLTIFGSKDRSSRTCWPVFLQNSYNTLPFFEQVGWCFSAALWVFVE